MRQIRRTIFSALAALGSLLAGAGIVFFTMAMT
jgi:hypothetical protein